MIKINLYDGKTHQLIKSFEDKQDAYMYQNHIAPNSYLRMEKQDVERNSRKSKKR